MFLCCKPACIDGVARREGSRNDRFEFLVLVGLDDLESRWWRKSHKDKIMKAARELNGVVHWGLYTRDSCSCCDQPYQIKGMLQKHIMYVKLPKEELYVHPVEWEREYMKSQIQELIYIFRVLGAKELDITLHRRTEHGGGAHAEAGLNAYGIEVGAGVDMENAESNHSKMRAHMTFEADSLDTMLEVEEVQLELTDEWEKEKKEIMTKANILAVPTRRPEQRHTDTAKLKRERIENHFINRLMVDPRIHYLVSYPDWLHFIKERVKGKAKTIHYIYSYSSSLKVSRNVFMKMEDMGIDIGYQNTEKEQDKIEIEAKFTDDGEACH